MVSFDRSQPYMEILGQPGLAFQQNGQTFNACGEVVTDFGALKVVDSEPSKPSPRDDSMLRIIELKTDEGHKKEEQGIENMHWATLKKMVQAYGGEYTSREQAISFLKNGS